MSGHSGAPPCRKHLIRGQGPTSSSSCLLPLSGTWDGQLASRCALPVYAAPRGTWGWHRDRFGGVGMMRHVSPPWQPHLPLAQSDPAAFTLSVPRFVWMCRDRQTTWNLGPPNPNHQPSGAREPSVTAPSFNQPALSTVPPPLLPPGQACFLALSQFGGASCHSQLGLKQVKVPICLHPG